jgi:hypothetical protein
MITVLAGNQIIGSSGQQALDNDRYPTLSEQLLLRQP